MNDLALALMYLALGCAVGGLIAWSLYRPRHVDVVESPEAERSAELVLARQALALPENSTPIFGELLQGRDTSTGVLVPSPLGGDEMLFFGPMTAAAELGEIVGHVPAQLASVVVRADSVVKLGIAIGEDAGVLVRLTGESARHFRESRKVVDGAGKMLSIFKDANGKFVHVARFTSAKGLQVASGGLGAISAIVMQAQLAEQERKLAEILEITHAIKRVLDRNDEAERHALLSLLMETYSSASAVGVLTDSAWDQIAPHRLEAHKQLRKAQLLALDCIHDLRQHKHVSARRGWLETNEAKIQQALQALVQAERAQLQYDMLHIWRLAVVGDPALEYQTEMLRMQLQQRHAALDPIRRELIEVLGQTGNVRLFEYVTSPFDARRIGTKAQRMLDRYVDSGLIVFPRSELAAEDTVDESPQLESRQSDDVDEPGNEQG